MDTAHLLPSSPGYSALPATTSVLWATDDNISNLEDTKHWHRNNRLLIDFLFLSTLGAAASFLLHFKPKRDSATSQVRARQLALQRQGSPKQQFDTNAFAVHQQGSRNRQNKPSNTYFGTQHLRATCGLTTSGRMQTFSDLCSKTNDFRTKNSF